MEASTGAAQERDGTAGMHMTSISHQHNLPCRHLTPTPSQATQYTPSSHFITTSKSHIHPSPTWPMRCAASLE